MTLESYGADIMSWDHNTNRLKSSLKAFLKLSLKLPARSTDSFNQK